MVGESKFAPQNRLGSAKGMETTMFHLGFRALYNAQEEGPRKNLHISLESQDPILRNSLTSYTGFHRDRRDH